MRTPAELSRSTFSELWKLTKNLQQYEEHFFKKNDRVSVRTVKFSVLKCVIFPHPLPSSAVLMKTSIVTTNVSVKNNRLGATGGDGASFKAPFLDNCHLTCLALPWNFLLATLIFIWPDSKLTHCGATVENNQWLSFSIALEAEIIFWANKRQTKKL